MDQKRHKRKESFSLLLLSDTGGSSRQFHITLFSIRFTLLLLLLFLAALIGLIVFSYAGSQKQAALHAQLASCEEQISQLDSEKQVLANENQALKAEIEDLRQVSRIITSKKDENAAAAEAEADTSLPTLFPSSDPGMIMANYSQEQPYISFNTHIESNIIATADGTVSSIGSDDTYPLIIEIQHENGYQTRYMCHEATQIQAEDGAQVKAGDILCTITTDNTQLDYQILINGEPIDPLNVIDAKG